MLFPHQTEELSEFIIQPMSQKDKNRIEDNANSSQFVCQF